MVKIRRKYHGFATLEIGHKGDARGFRPLVNFVLNRLAVATVSFFQDNRKRIMPVYSGFLFGQQLSCPCGCAGH
jgi:hypothetical protein